MDTAQIELSVVIPCLNEEETIGECVREAREAIEAMSISAEIVVADNGSTDRSAEIATHEGARCVPVLERGYGSALSGGFSASRGKWILFADGDGSYDFGELPKFLAKLRAGADFVASSRFRGTIEPGAMPFLHRYLGTPVLTMIHRLFFHSKVTDCQSGMRALRRELLPALDLRTKGMEFITEMLVKAALLGLKIEEVPITLRRDKRSKQPHLKTWRDGWRNLRFLLLYSPLWLFVIPGLTLILIGAGMALLVLPGPYRIGPNIGLDVHTLLTGSMSVICGYQLLLMGLYARQFAQVSGLIPRKSEWLSPFQKISLELGIVIGVVAAVAGFVPLLCAIRHWSQSGFGPQDYSATMRMLIPGLSLCVLGLQTIFGSFLFSLLRIRL